MTRPTLILVAALALTGCAVPNVDHSAINFNESQFSIDLNVCRGGNIAEASLKTIGKGVVGSLAGAGFTAVNGAAAPLAVKPSWSALLLAQFSGWVSEQMTLSKNSIRKFLAAFAIRARHCRHDPGRSTASQYQVGAVRLQGRPIHRREN